MNYLFTFIFCCISTLGFSQDISGYWKGTITQNEGGYRSEYVLELWIVQTGDSIKGKSFVFVDNIYAEMNISGTFQNGIYLNLQDDKIITHDELKGMEWCIKSYQLLLKRKEGKWSFIGDWQGVTSFSSCIPGKIFLKKAKPRA